MKIDLILAVLGSLAVHAGIGFGDRLLPATAESAPAVVAEKTPVLEITVPPIEPEPEESTDIPDTTASAADSVADLAPPTQADLPSAVIDSPFVQQIAAPRPAGLSVSTGSITIPKGNLASAGNLRGAAGNLFDLANLDQAPVPVAQIPPQYPADLRRRGVTGEVLVRFIVDAKGAVRNATVVRSTAREFDEPALDALSRWRFKPGRKGGVAVNTRMEIPLEFSLR